MAAHESSWPNGLIKPQAEQNPGKSAQPGSYRPVEDTSECHAGWHPAQLGSASGPCVHPAFESWLYGWVAAGQWIIMPQHAQCVPQPAARMDGALGNLI